MNGNTVWQSQSIEAPRISLQYVRRQAERLNSGIQRELRFGYFGTALSALLGLVAVFAPAPAWSAVEVPAVIVWVVQLTALLSFLACGYITFQIRRRGKLQQAVEHEQVMQSLHAYRTALERRRDHYSSAWRWSFWPVIPSVTIVFGGGLLFDERPGKWLRYSLSAVVCAVAFLCAAWVSWRKSAGFQREIDALETLDENAPRGAGRG
jgi:hypothetical protein